MGRRTRRSATPSSTSGEHLRGVPEPYQELSENPTQRQDRVGADPESPLVEERRRRYPDHRPQSPRCSSAQPHSLQLLKGVCLELLLRNRCPLLFLLKVPDIMFGQRIVYALLIPTVCLACFVLEYLINCIGNKHPRIITK